MNESGDECGEECVNEGVNKCNDDHRYEYM